MEIKTNKTMSAADRFAINFFLSLSVNEVIKQQLPKEENPALRQWIMEQIATSASIMFPEPFDA